MAQLTLKPRVTSGGPILLIILLSPVYLFLSYFIFQDIFGLQPLVALLLSITFLLPFVFWLLKWSRSTYITLRIEIKDNLITIFELDNKNHTIDLKKVQKIEYRVEKKRAFSPYRFFYTTQRYYLRTFIFNLYPEESVWLTLNGFSKGSINQLKEYVKLNFPNIPITETSV